MFISTEINKLPIGGRVAYERAGYDIELTRNFCQYSEADNKLTVVILPRNFRSDDEWTAGVKDSKSANEFVQKSIGYRF